MPIRVVMAAFPFALLAAIAPLAAQHTSASNGGKAPHVAAAAQHPPASDAIPTIVYRRFILPDGLTLIVHEDHKAPIVAVNVWYHVGSKNETPGKTGFAHLFEHLMFTGSEDYKQDFMTATEPIGATDMNGTTNHDRTNYFEDVPVSALDRVLWLESDRMGHLLGSIDQHRVDEQRGVVQNEKRQGENQPYGRTGITIAENTYPKGHPYSWSVIGSMKDLDAASLADVKTWFRTYYGAANATLSIAGDVNTDSVHAAVLRYFGDIPSGPPVTTQHAWTAKMTGEHRQTMQDRVPQPGIFEVWNVPAYGSADETYLDLAASILGDGTSSRLYKRLVYHDRIATSAQAYIDAREIGSQFHLEAMVQPGGDAHQVEGAMEAELRHFIADGPTAAELARAKTQMRAQFIRGIERIGGFGGTSDILARGQVMLGDPAAYRTILLRAMRATPADLQAAARRWLSDGVYVLTVKPFPHYTTVASTVDRSKLPPIGTPPAAPLPSVQRTTLSNGLKVVLARRTAVPVVNLALVLDAGFAADGPSTPGISSMTMRMLDQGTRTRNALQIADQLASMGAELNAGSSLDAATVSMSVLRDKLDPALALYSDVILHPTFPAADLAREKQNTLARIQQEKVQPFGLALRVLPALLYGAGHPYSEPLTGTGTAASVRAMTPTALAQFHDSWFRPNHATIVVVGDITMAELEPRLERAFASWKAGTVPALHLTTVQPAAKPVVYLLDRPGAGQSIIIGGELIPPTGSPEDIAFATFNNAFGGSFTSRINMDIREDKHWSYGAFSFAMDARGQRPWLVYAPVQTDKTSQSLAEMVKDTRAVAADSPVTAQELADAKGKETRTLAGRWETAAAVSGALRRIAIYGLPHDYYTTYAARIDSLAPATVASAVGQFVHPDHLVWVVVGDRAKIESGIRALGIGDVRVLNADGRPVASR